MSVLEMVRPSGSRAVLEKHHGDYVNSFGDVAGILGVGKRTVFRLVEAGKIKAINVSLRRRGVLASEVARVLNEGL